MLVPVFSYLSWSNDLIRERALSSLYIMNSYPELRLVNPFYICEGDPEGYSLKYAVKFSSNILQNTIEVRSFIAYCPSFPIFSFVAKRFFSGEFNHVT